MKITTILHEASSWNKIPNINDLSDADKIKELDALVSRVSRPWHIETIKDMSPTLADTLMKKYYDAYQGIFRSGYKPSDEQMTKWARARPYIIGDAIRLYGHVPDDALIAALSKSGQHLTDLLSQGYIPSDDVLIAAVTKKKSLAKIIPLYIKTPSIRLARSINKIVGYTAISEPNLQSTAPITQSNNFSTWTDEDIIELIKKTDPGNIKNIIKDLKNPSDEVQVAAVKREVSILSWLHVQSQKAIEVALKKNPWNIGYVKTPTTEQMMKAIKQDSSVIRSLATKDNITLPNEVIQAGLTSDQFIHGQSKEYYDKTIQLIFPTNTLLINKWIRYGDKRREELKNENK